MATIAVMTVSDGRSYVHREIETFGLNVQERIVAALAGAGHRVVTAEGDIHSNASAVAIARELAAARPDLTIVNVPVWAFPHFTMLAARRDAGAAAAVLEHRPAVPGHGRHARGRRRPRPDRPHARPGLGRRRDPAVLARLERAGPGRRRGRTACAARRSAGSAAARWGCTPPSRTPTSGCSKFGVDVEEIDQWETRPPRGRRSTPARQPAAREWLETDTPPASTTTATG